MMSSWRHHEAQDCIDAWLGPSPAIRSVVASSSPLSLASSLSSYVAAMDAAASVPIADTSCSHGIVGTQASFS
jgi:hypothetical protein